MKEGRLSRLKVKISNFKLKDMLDFKNLPRRRDKAIDSAEDKVIQTDFPINSNARALHPAVQRMVVSRIIERGASDARTLILTTEDGKPAAWFRAGQYVSVSLKIGDSRVTRPYSISSSPKLTKDGRIHITVKGSKNGFVADYILKDLKEGDSVLVSGPEGRFYHDPLRDSLNVVAVAGGSGITPFLSMAYAIRDGLENFNLTILYGSRTEESILFRNELESITEETDKVQVVHVLSDEQKPDFEHGFITADLIRKYAPEDYSLFICGPQALYSFMESVVSELNLPVRRVRREIIGVSGNMVAGPCEEEVFHTITVHQGPYRFEIKASSKETVLVAMERAGITAPARCRSGECGWCRSKLLSGSVFIPSENDFRRRKDKDTDHIHPCVTFPCSNLEIEVPRGDSEV
ncbi:MAG: iron-sulfur cluster-binding domain-containing protein [bacterium]|nr:iron-sulfur cluster-binding domain-containing protein [bacterium]